MSDGGQIDIFLNGEARTIPVVLTLPGLLASLGLPDKGVLVEHNGIALFQHEWSGVHLAAGDRVEILRVVAGG